MSSSTCSGAVQLTPTATTPGASLDGLDRLLDGGAAPQVPAVGAGEADPGRRPGHLGEERGDRLGLLELRDRLHREHVGAGPGEDREPLAVEVAQLGHGPTVAAAVLGAVGQHGAVRPDGRRDEQWPADALVERLRPRLLGQLHGPAEQVRGSVVVQIPRAAKPSNVAWYEAVVATRAPAR